MVSFDNNVSLFTRGLDEALSLDSMLARAESAPGILDATLGRQGRVLAGAVQRAQLERLVDFSFDSAGFIEDYRSMHPHSPYTLTDTRLDLLSAFIRARARLLVG